MPSFRLNLLEYFRWWVHEAGGREVPVVNLSVHHPLRGPAGFEPYRE
jgi:hypothetical protein